MLLRDVIIPINSLALLLSLRPEVPVGWAGYRLNACDRYRAILAIFVSLARYDLQTRRRNRNVFIRETGIPI